MSFRWSFSFIPIFGSPLWYSETLLLWAVIIIIFIKRMSFLRLFCYFNLCIWFCIAIRPNGSKYVYKTWILFLLFQSVLSSFCSQKLIPPEHDASVGYSFFLKWFKRKIKFQNVSKMKIKQNIKKIKQQSKQSVWRPKSTL